MNDRTAKNRFLSFFKYEERGASLRGDLLGGFVTFLAMCYILPVTSTVLSSTGMDAGGVFAATALVSGLVTILMGVIGNAPIALSSGMGLSAFLSYTVCGQLGYSWQEAFLVLTLTGLLFFVFSLTPIRRKIIAAFPRDLKRIISAGLGAFLAFVGLKGSGVVTADPATFVRLGSLSKPSVLLALFGIFLALTLFFVKTKKGLLSSLSVPLSMLSVALVGYLLRVCGVEDSALPNVDFTSNWGVSGIENVFFYGALGNEGELCDFGTMIPSLFGRMDTYAIVFSLLFVHLFDTTATLMTVGKETGITDESGNLLTNRPIFVDAVGALICAPIGTSTITSCAESAIGVKSGAKTGLASLLSGSLFIAAAFLYPVFELFTAPCVSAAALVSVGALIFVSNFSEIDWKAPEISFCSFVTVLFIVLTYSLANGIGFGLFAYVLISLVRGKGKEISWILYLIAALYLVLFAVNEVVARL